MPRPAAAIDRYGCGATARHGGVQDRWPGWMAVTRGLERGSAGAMNPVERRLFQLTWQARFGGLCWSCFRERTTVGRCTRDARARSRPEKSTMRRPPCSAAPGGRDVARRPSATAQTARCLAWQCLSTAPLSPRWMDDACASKTGPPRDCHGPPDTGHACPGSSDTHTPRHSRMHRQRRSVCDTDRRNLYGIL